jgi:protein AFG1
VAAATAAVENSTSDSRDLRPERKAKTGYLANTEDIGPIQEYDRRVASGVLRNDEHQRGEAQR